nr:3-oxoacyl-ACP reductase FabG [Oceanococcus sp. HetDA_MAG_MS8]
MTEQRSALVTGATRGIGAAIANALQDAGYMVVGTATSAHGAQAITERGLKGAVLDVSQPQSFPDFVKAHGPFACIVHNAGVTRDNLLLRLDDAAIAEVLHTNLIGAISLTRACLRGMMKQRFGRVVCLGSVVGAAGNAGQTNYAASKAGLEGFARSLAREVASREITANVVAPGFIDTDMTRGLSEEQRQSLLGSIPLGRLGQPEDIAAAVRFLCSDEAAYITGQTLHVNGGMYMG